MRKMSDTKTNGLNKKPKAFIDVQRRRSLRTICYSRNSFFYLVTGSNFCIKSKQSCVRTQTNNKIDQPILKSTKRVKKCNHCYNKFLISNYTFVSLLDADKRKRVNVYAMLILERDQLLRKTCFWKKSRNKKLLNTSEK